ncbi:MAG: hypothetical protein M2R45_01559 [Verrucomicrobia subdivision 3 bacterium]|nr:hypothetical protein [Limisphaerales bacterium]MCS1413313.1 hypothetical protein [Limisphaerales bacterium]
MYRNAQAFREFGSLDREPRGLGQAIEVVGRSGETCGEWNGVILVLEIEDNAMVPLRTLAVNWSTVWDRRISRAFGTRGIVSSMRASLFS